ncbi:hypothetical protein M758_1G238900 [Ceratodon purpureus]|nr:hypothetical protein M758_1G238900 [Ceratodon purpureus]
MHSTKTIASVLINSISQFLMQKIPTHASLPYSYAHAHKHSSVNITLNFTKYTQISTQTLSQPCNSRHTNHSCLFQSRAFQSEKTEPETPLERESPPQTHTNSKKTKNKTENKNDQPLRQETLQQNHQSAGEKNTKQTNTHPLCR